MDFSPIEYRGIKCRSDLQTNKHNVKSWLTNLRNFQATDTFYACFHRSTAFIFTPSFVTYSIPSTSFVAALMLQARSFIEFLSYITNWNQRRIQGCCNTIITKNSILDVAAALDPPPGTFDFAGSRGSMVSSFSVSHSFGF